MPDQSKARSRLWRRLRPPSQTLSLSHQRVIENIDRWANSPGLRPPERSSTADRVKSDHARK